MYTQEQKRARWREEWKKRYARKRLQILDAKRKKYATDPKLRDYHKNYVAQWKNRPEQRQAREFVNQIKAATPCTDCHISYIPYVMEFDHIPGKPKLGHIAELAMYRAPIEVLLEEIAKCEVVCANCHRIRTYNRSQVGLNKKVH